MAGSQDVAQVGAKLEGIGVLWRVATVLAHLGRRRSHEARRLLEQGGVRRDGEPWRQIEERLTGPVDALVGSIWQVGRRAFARMAGLTSG